MNNYGMKIAKEGKNVLTSQERDLIYSSKFRTLKVFKSGTVINTTDANGDFTSEVTHSLGFIPAFTAFRKAGTTQTDYLNGERPAASEDDTYIDGSSIYNSEVFILCGNNNNSGGIRFTSVNITEGSTIVYAKIRLYAYESQSGTDAKVRIEGEKNVNVGAFTTRANYLSKPSTTATISWTMPAMTADTVYDTPNIKTIVQEIIDQSGWDESDKSMLFMLKDNGSSSGAYRKFYSYDGIALPNTLEAELYIYYEEAATVSNIYCPNPNNPNNDIAQFYESLAYADKNKLYLRMENAMPTTTYEFKYYVFADFIDNAGGISPPGFKDSGLKMTPLPKNVLNTQLYEQSFTSRLRTMKIDPYFVGTKLISLPALTTGEQTVNVDITHGFGYPPYFMAFYNSDITNSTRHMEIPDYYLDAVDSIAFKIYHWCDNVKVRISAWRYRNPLGSNLAAEQITVRYYIFRENLELV